MRKAFVAGAMYVELAHTNEITTMQILAFQRRAVLMRILRLLLLPYWVMWTDDIGAQQCPAARRRNQHARVEPDVMGARLSVLNSPAARTWSVLLLLLVVVVLAADAASTVHQRHNCRRLVSTSLSVRPAHRPSRDSPPAADWTRELMALNANITATTSILYCTQHYHVSGSYSERCRRQ